MTRLHRIAAHRASHIAFAFLGMGGWAFWANRMHDMPVPMIAGVVQGLISASLTVAMQALILATLRRSHSKPLAMVLAGLMSLATLLTIHSLAGTPEILVTIALPWCIGLTYAVLFTLGQSRKAPA